MHVRSFQLSDASQMTELLQVALSEECYENTMGPFARQLSWDSDLIMVAEEEGDLVGALIGTIDHNQGCYLPYCDTSRLSSPWSRQNTCRGYGTTFPAA